MSRSAGNLRVATTLVCFVFLMTASALWVRSQDMPGMKMPAASPNPQASPQQKMEMNMPMPAASPGASPQKMEMNMLMPSASPSASPMGQMSGMNMGGMNMNMGPLMVMNGNDMGIRVGSSDKNIMSMAQMGSGTSWNPASSPMYMIH